MIILRADDERLEKATTTTEAFAAFGLGEKEDTKFTDDKVFGKKANYENMFCTDVTYQRIYDLLNKNDRQKARSKNGNVWSPAAVNWCWYSPISSGPRFNEFEKNLSGLDDNRIYIVTPDDAMYKEARE